MDFKKIKTIFILLFLALVSCGQTLPSGFVYLSDLDPTIIQSVRYFTNENFIGRPIKGYKNPKIIITAAAAKALKDAQKEFNENGYSLVVYDAYRPQEAVIDSFVKWAVDLNDESVKTLYYPTIKKGGLFTLGLYSF